MKMMQHVYIADGSYSSFKRNGKTYLGVIPAVRDVTAIIIDDNYIGYLPEHLSYQEVKLFDLKFKKRSDVYENFDDAEKVVKVEMEKFLSYDDGRDYWVKKDRIIRD